MNPLAVYLTMREALTHLRSHHGPAVIEAEVYRYFHQNGAFPGSAFRYRSKEEEASWRARESILQSVTWLLRMEQAARGHVSIAYPD